MTRNRERRSFTVAAKSSGQQGFVSIPAKAPRVPQKPARRLAAPDPWASPVEAAAVVPAAKAQDEPRRILPNLNAWEAPAPEPLIEAEPRLPRVRRVAPQGGIEEAPRRRGRPRKHPLPIETVSPVALEPEPMPVPATRPAAEVPVFVPRKARPQSEGLRLGERWKRRLPRACW